MSNVGAFSRLAFPFIRKSYPALIANSLIGVQPMTGALPIMYSHEMNEPFGYFKMKIKGVRKKCRIVVSLLNKYDYSNPDNDIIVEAHSGAWYWEVNISRGCVKSTWVLYRGHRKVLLKGERWELVSGCRVILGKLGRGDSSRFGGLL
jgi:hypothetical protein